MIWLRGILLMIAMAASAGMTTVQAKETAIGRQVRFTGAGGVSLAGTLVIPMTGIAPYPAILLLQGSGATDRDGNQPPDLRTDLFSQIADMLAGHGIASLRYDKRGIYANAAGLPADKSDYPAFFGWTSYVGDATAAIDYLATQPGIDAGRVGMLGHSEGGLIALAVADDLQRRGKPPAALVLAAAPGRPLNQIITEQIERALRLQKATQQQQRFFLSANRRITKAIIDTGHVPDTVPPGLAPFYPDYAGPFLKAVLSLDPAKLAHDYAGPVLLLQGANDVQISAQNDALSLDRALLQRGHDDHALFIVPGVSHNMKPVDDAETQPGLDGPVSDAIRDRLVDWLTAKLGR